jgi:hypothetical protein
MRWWCLLHTWTTPLVKMFIMLAHWNNSLRVDMSLYSDTLSWFYQTLLLLINIACFAEKKQIPISLFFVWPDWGLNPWSTTIETSMLTITPLMQYIIKKKQSEIVADENIFIIYIIYTKFYTVIKLWVLFRIIRGIMFISPKFINYFRNVITSLSVNVRKSITRHFVNVRKTVFTNCQLNWFIEYLHKKLLTANFLSYDIDLWKKILTIYKTDLLPF